MTSRCEGVLITLLCVAKANKRKYCFPKQATVEKLLKTYHGFGISNRTLNRDLRWLEDHGWVERVRRHFKNARGEFVPRSTLYKFKGKVFNWLVSKQNQVKRIFLHFRLPRWADNQLSQKGASSPNTLLSAQKVVIQEKDGTLYEWDARVGVLKGIGT